MGLFVSVLGLPSTGNVPLQRSQHCQLPSLHSAGLHGRARFGPEHRHAQRIGPLPAPVRLPWVWRDASNANWELKCLSAGVVGQCANDLQYSLRRLHSSCGMHGNRLPASTVRGFSRWWGVSQWLIHNQPISSSVFRVRPSNHPMVDQD